MAINYKSYEFQCYEYIRRMESLLDADSDPSLEPWRKEAEQLRRNLESRRFRVAVVGEFNRGKTSFVNALLGREILPADAMPATAAINRITYGDIPRAYLSMKDGQRRPVEISELADYVTKFTAAAAQNAALIDEAVVEYPALFCRSGVDLIDTPGMNDAEDMNQATVSRLEDIDLAIVAVDASIPFSLTERAFTAQLLESPQVCQIVFVITKIDQIPARERKKAVEYLGQRIKDAVLEHLESYYEPDHPIIGKYHDIFDHLCLFPVSSVDALDALSCNDMDLFRESGFARLNDELPQIILTSQNSNVILNSERVLGGIIQRYRGWLDYRRETRREQLPRLDALKEDFLRLCGETSRAIAAPPDDAGLPDVEQETASLRKSFIQALAQMRVLNYAALQEAMHPVIKSTFQSLNQRLAAEERAWMEDYERRVLAPAGKRLGAGLKSLLEPFPPIYEALSGSVSLLDLYILIPEADKEPERFFWTVSPLPEPSRLGADWQVMPVVDAAIRASLLDYRRRRGERIARLLAQAGKRLDAAAQSVAGKLAVQVDQYMHQLSDGQLERPLLEGLDRLKSDCRTMREKFRAELGQTGPEVEDAAESRNGSGESIG